MLAFASDNAVSARDQTQEALKALSQQLDLANRAASRFRTSLPNRDEAINELSRTMGGAESAARPYAALFVADALSALRLRHGTEVSEYILDEVSRKRLFPLVPNGRIFRWSAQAVLIIWHSQNEIAEISTAIANACQAPFDCRAFVGTRTAIFRIALRFTVLDLDINPAAGFVRTLDSFAKEADTR